MASSRSYNSTPGRRNSGSQLLQELEALSQSLHMFQQPLTPRRTGYLSQSIAKKLQTTEEQYGARDEAAMSLPALANSGHQSTAPSASRNFRHSTAHPRPAESNVMDVKATRFSASATSGISSEKVDIRGRRSQYSPSPFPMRAVEESNLADDNKNILQSEDVENLGFSKKMEHKKLGIWTWKPIRALSHIGMERFSCVFSVYVNAIHGLSPSVNGLRLTVSLRKKETRDGAVQTMPARVFQSVAEFDETLYIKCHVYGRNSSSHGSSQGFMKFQSRPFIISVVAIEEKEVDFGKYNVDLSMLLQESVQNKSAGKDCGDGWNASFALRGNGRGAKLVVGLGYEILEKGAARYQIGSCRFKEYSDQVPDIASSRISKSLPSSSRGTPKMIAAHGFPNAYAGSDSLFQSQMLRMESPDRDIVRIAHLHIDDPPSPEPELQSQTFHHWTPNGTAERGSEQVP